jgi:SAM-dependent MidA family methyltransferase
MGSSSGSTRVSPQFLAVFRAHADQRGRMSFATFMDLALYHPGVGYYRRPGVRVGRGPGTDFYTASTSSPVFGELVASACATLLESAQRNPRQHRFIELGTEPGSDGVLAGVDHSFANVSCVRLADPIALAGECVVFSNELFDAQPFVRTVFRGGRWIELGVELRGDALVEVELDSPPPVAAPSAASSREDYRFDQPIAAASLAERIAAQSWRGLFVAFDYGKTFRELVENTPAGTARAYFQHTQSNDLVARPGEQDLTCHICWDWIADALRRHGFREPALSFQEAFLIRHAGPRIAAISAAEARQLSPRKLALMQLLHPSQMGHKFQVMHALR